MMVDRILYRKAQCQALKYEFIESIEELNQLTHALYLAMEWGRKTK